MNTLVGSPAFAIADIGRGALLAVSGFGTCWAPIELTKHYTSWA